MKRLQKLPIYLTFLTLIGCTYAWTMAMVRGFSNQRLVCLGIKHDGSCSVFTRIYWTDNTILWLVPYILIIVLATWLIAAKILPKKTPALVITAMFLISFLLIFLFAFTQDSQKRPTLRHDGQVVAPRG
jgi:glucan phosphoethanolaminetransferase (alkaline phosphatase superfamily)